MNQSRNATIDRYLALAVAILLLGLAFRAHDLGDVSFWGDEVTTKIRAAGSLAHTVNHISRGGTHFLPYFASLHLFPSDNEFLLRMPSLYMALLSIALMIRAARWLFSHWQFGLAAGALVAFSHYHIYLSRMARPYAQLFFFSLLSSYFFLRLLSGKRSTGLWIGYIIATMLVLQTHYFALALPLAQIAILVLLQLAGQDQRRLIVRWTAAQGITFLPTVLWLAFVTQPKQGAMDWITRPTWDAPLETLGFMLTGYERDLVVIVALGLLVSAAGLITGVVVGIRCLQTNPALMYWTILTAGPIAGIFGISLIGDNSYYMDRYFMVLLPGLLLLVLGGWHTLRGLPWARIGVVVLLLTSSVTIVREFRSGENYERFAWRQAIAFAEARMQPGDYLALPYYDPAFEYYYGDMYQGPIVPLYVMNDQLEGFYAPADIPYKRMWFFYAPELHGEKVTRWLEKVKTLETYEFNGLRVRVLQLPEGGD